jgi:mannose-6-phosphate isomerase-like protein (cupin superfamily)
MKKLHVTDLSDNGSRILSRLFSGRRITHGSVHVFKPGECAHPEPHSHDTDEVFIVLQGSGTMPVDGVSHPIKTGDVIVIEPGEDHHTTGSVDDPMVVAWYLMEPPGRPD